MLLIKLLKCLCVSSTEETFSGILSISQMCNFGETIFRSLLREVFLGKGVLKICSKFTREHLCQRAIIEITLRHGCSPINLLHIFRTNFLNPIQDGGSKKTSPPTSFSPVISTNAEISPQTLLTFSFNTFATLV